FNSGRVRRNGYVDSQLDSIQQRSQHASEARAQEAAGGEVLYSGDANLTDEQIAKLPFDLYRQGYEYYWKTHAHPNSTFKYTTSSLLDLMRFDATDQIELIQQPLLIIAGSDADSLYMSENAFARATGAQDKELFLIDGATHIETYWVPEYVDQALAKLKAFFGKTLCNYSALFIKNNKRCLTGFFAFFPFCARSTSAIKKNPAKRPGLPLRRRLPAML